MTHSPFGTEINAQSILDDLDFFDDWEDRYRYIIDLGKQLPAMPEQQKTEDNFVHGCQSQVWISHDYDPVNDRLSFQVDTDAFIVRGLAAMMMAAYNAQSPKAILSFDIDDYFNQSQLIQHLSPTRGNGLKAMANKIRNTATDYLSAS